MDNIRFLIGFIVTLIINIIITLLLIFKYSNTPQIDHQVEIDSLKTNIKQNEIKLNQIDSINKSLQDSIVLYGFYIEENNIKIKNIKKIYNEKIDSVAKLDAYGLKMYFAKRYP